MQVVGAIVGGQLVLFAIQRKLALCNPVGEAAVLRELADLYEQRNDMIAAVRCVERLHHLALGTGRAPAAADRERLARLRTAMAERPIAE